MKSRGENEEEVQRIFLLSPAKASGRRAQLLTRPQATFELARQVQIGAASLGDVFTFCSGLYFRGKLTYAQRFARPPVGTSGIQVITPSRGLMPADANIGLADLREFSAVSVDAAEERFTTPLRQSVKALVDEGGCDIVLLGSVASGKYVETLLPILGERLIFPEDFVGRGDMSRGGLLLRQAAKGEELHYIPVIGSVRRGRRPPKLSPK
jgi:hypothetical protein